MARQESYIVPKLDLQSVNQTIQKIQRRMDEVLETAVKATASGVITIWSGDVTDIPAGWLICDGTNGTPDLSASYVGTTVFIMKA